MKFKVGDRVICIEVGRTILIGNKVYIIENINKDGFIRLEYDDFEYSPLRFEPAYIKEFKNKLDKILEE